MNLRPLPVVFALSGLLLLAGCSTPVTKPAAGNVTVEFKDADNFRDATDSLGGHTDQNALAELRACLEQNAPAHLQEGQKLHVTFTDIDLAGEFLPGDRLDRVRIIKPIYVPRLEFTFAVTDAAGQTVKQGTRALTDLNFQVNAGRIGSDRAYYYDKLLLEEWLKKEFK
jgi:hypothetical protein